MVRIVSTVTVMANSTRVKPLVERFGADIRKAGIRKNDPDSWTTVLKKLVDLWFRLLSNIISNPRFSIFKPLLFNCQMSFAKFQGNFSTLDPDQMNVFALK